MSKKETYYFSHDSNARNDEKILAVRMRLGAEGYGIYFMLIERLLESTEYMSIKDYNVIAFDLRVSAEKIKVIIEDFGLFTFTEDGKRFYSESLINRMKPLDNLREQRRAAGKKSAEKRAKNQDNEQDSTTVERPLQKNETNDDFCCPENEQSKVKYSIVNNNTVLPNGNCRVPEISVPVTTPETPEEEASPAPPTPPKQTNTDRIDFANLLKSINKYTGRGFKVINDKVKKSYRARLKDGYTKEIIFMAIKNAAKSEYHKNNGCQFLTPEFFSRADMLDKWGSNSATKNVEPNKTVTSEGVWSV